MDPDKKRKIRLVIALGLAVVLAAALVYTSFSASNETKEPSEVLAAGPGDKYEMTGRVVDGSLETDGNTREFEVADREDADASVPVVYNGQVPDPFREGREVIVTGELDQGGTFVAEKDSLVTKCPSKFAEEAKEDPEHVVIE